MKKRRCPNCHTRYVQDSETGLCRRCGRQTGKYTPANKALDAAFVQRMAEQLMHKPKKPERRPDWYYNLPRVPRLEVFEGVLFEVVWDGRRDLDDEEARRR